MELRERIQGGQALKSRTERVEEEMARHFTMADRMLVRETRTFDPPILRDLLTATYRGFRQSERAAVESLSTMSVTLCHEILAFQLR